MRLVKRAALPLLVAYSLVHFAYSGILTPLASPNIRQIAYETRGLVAHIATGQPVIVDESDQYGPVFLFVMDPMLRICGGNAWPLSRCAYASELVTLAASFVFTLLSLRLWLRSRSGDRSRPISDWTLVGVLLVLWLNFSPLNYIVTSKGVEMWEVALILGALYAFLRGHRILSGVAIAAATFIKILPGIFIIYFIMRDRRAFVGSVLGSLAILGAAEILYGHQMGFGYPGLIARAAVTTAPDAAVGLHVNLAMKNLVVKAMGHLEVPPESQTDNRIGYKVTIDPEQLRRANAIGLALHGLAMAVVVIAIARRRRRADPAPAAEIMWDWAFVSTMMLVVAPAATYEYMLLSIFGFSFALAWLLGDREATRARGTVALIAVATLLVANILPRSVINEVLLVDLLRRWSGYVHLTLSETYQYFGIPLLGLLFLAAALLLIRPRLVSTARVS